MPQFKAKVEVEVSNHRESARFFGELFTKGFERTCKPAEWVYSGTPPARRRVSSIVFIDEGGVKLNYLKTLPNLQIIEIVEC